MSIPDKNTVLRRSFRASVPDRQQAVVLKAGERRFSVRLLNESVEGAAVQVDEDPGVRTDDVVRLTTTLDSFEARVAHVSEIEPAEAGASVARPRFRLGLEWLKGPILPPPQQTAPPEATLSPDPCLPGET